MERILATYRIAALPGEIAARAHAIATEQSVEMPPDAVPLSLRETMLGRIESVVPAGETVFRVTLSYSALAVEPAEAGALLNLLFGNSSLHDDVVLEDAALPLPLLAAFGGPRLGMPGLRALTGVPGHRPLTCAALKPLGLDAAALGRLAGELAHGGIDIIKDDHNLADQTAAPFATRLAECARPTAGTGTLYAPHVTGALPQLLAQAAAAQDAGLRAVLVCPMLVGLPAFQALRAAMPELALIAHPAMAGGARIAPAFLVGTLFRLLGADATVFPGYGGRFGYTQKTCAAIASAARVPLSALKSCCPVPAGGMTPQRIPEMMDFYGADTMLLIGGALLADPAGPASAARRFVAAVENRLS